jgi:hypothetical protein
LIRDSLLLLLFPLFLLLLERTFIIMPPLVVPIPDLPDNNKANHEAKEKKEQKKTKETRRVQSLFLLHSLILIPSFPSNVFLPFHS